MSHNLTLSDEEILDCLNVNKAAESKKQPKANGLEEEKDKSYLEELFSTQTSQVEDDPTREYDSLVRMTDDPVLENYILNFNEDKSNAK